MNHSNFTIADIQKSADFAHPYIKEEDSGNVSETAFHSVENVCPAGCINSNVEDMGRYAIFQLGKGKTGDRQIVSEANLDLTHTAQVPMSGSGEFKELGANSYGMGWVVTSYRGRRMIWHNGGIDGFYALLTMLPDEDLAVVILTNLLNQTAPEAVAYRIYDQMIGLDAIDWSTRYEQLYAKGKTAEEEAAKTEATKRKSGTHPSHDLKDYAGEYENPGYGTITVASAGEHFTATLNQMELPLQHYHYDVFEVPQRANWILGGLKIRFQTNMDGEIDSVVAPLEGDAPEIIFTRKAVKPHEPAK
jgi:Beta-lactamase class C and other penicillin binding proteins